MSKNKLYLHGNVVTIEQYDSPESPRDWDNLGTMICFHSRHNLGDKHTYSGATDFLESLLGEVCKTPEEHQRLIKKADTLALDAKSFDRALHEAFLTYIAERGTIILPLFLYDHSGITMSCSPFSCPWDSGQVGWIYVTREQMLAEYGKKHLSAKIRKAAELMLRVEVETFDQWLTGDVFGYHVNRVDDDDDLDSCWGFYGEPYTWMEGIRALVWDSPIMHTLRDLYEVTDKYRTNDWVGHAVYMMERGDIEGLVTASETEEFDRVMNALAGYELSNKRAEIVAEAKRG